MNKADILKLLKDMWIDYLRLNPEAQKIHQLLQRQNPVIINDHIALRTFDIESINIEVLAAPFLSSGYYWANEYHFPVKHLYAKHLQHTDTKLPKVFISQLLTESLNQANQTLIHNLISQIPKAQIGQTDFCYSGRYWNLSYADYQQLLVQSEYAAWVAAFGFRPNHFTIFINQLDSHNSIESINDFLKAEGFKLNSAGGEIKGGAEEYLAQSSTLANSISVQFTDRTAEIPSCYYEFAQRFPMPDGSLYQGFVAASADKIFESTHTR